VPSAPSRSAISPCRASRPQTHKVHRHVR
jgi:hypothetical protein